MKTLDEVLNEADKLNYTAGMISDVRKLINQAYFIGQQEGRNKEQKNPSVTWSEEQIDKAKDIIERVSTSDFYGWESDAQRAKDFLDSIK